jgi:hypothetical protein
MIDILTSFFIGLFAGAMLTEAVIIVPQWKLIPPLEFNKLHKVLNKRFFNFFAPITVLAVTFAQINTVIKYNQNEPLLIPMATSVLMLLCLASFYLFFKEANEKFKTVIYSKDELLNAIKVWHQVHWARTFISLIAFGLSLL